MALLGFLALVALAALYWVLRNGRRRAIEGWDEAACPVCIGLAEVVYRAVGEDTRRPDSPERT